MTKFRDILKGTMFESRINRIIDLAKNKWCRSLEQNDFIHSESIENHLDNLVPDEIKYNENIFEKAEIFLLLYGVYLHDIGRKTHKDHHEMETYNEIRKNYKEYLLENTFEAKAVADICYGHAKESEMPIKYIDNGYGIQELCNRRPLDLQFLAALLRLADEIDNTYVRVRGLTDQDDNPRNLIRFIHIDYRRWIIEFQCDSIDDEDLKKLQYGERLIQDRLNEIKCVLEPKGLLYHLISLDTQKRSEINRKKYDENVGKYDENVNITGFIYELNNRADAFIRLGRYEEAIELCDKALKIDPMHSLTWLTKGDALDELKKHKEAIECYDKALKIDPKNLAALNHKGAALSNNFKMYKEAIEYFDKILEIDPKHVLASINKSISLYNWGNDISELAKTKENKEKEELLIQAIEKYELALITNPDKYDAANNLGNALAYLAKTKENKEKEELLIQAIEKYKMALKIKPDLYEALENLPNHLEELAQMKEGKEKEELLKQSIERREMANEIKKKNINPLRANVTIN